MWAQSSGNIFLIIVRNQMNNLEGKIVFITGASSGIGKACAFEFAKLKSNLILAARRKDRLNTIAEEIINEFGVKVQTLELDVRNFEEVKNKL